MKFAAIIAVVMWLICGVAGAWRLGELNSGHWKAVARGPITLAKSLNDNPVTYPGP